VALQLGHQYAVAIHAQARRVQNPEHPMDRIPDIYLLVGALHNVLRATEMTKKSVSSTLTKGRDAEGDRRVPVPGGRQTHK
jgi:hypothetical protein